MRADGFYLGVHEFHWLWDDRFREVPLFISHRRLLRRRTPFPRAVTRWALDSGGYTELDKKGHWETTPEQYVASVRRYMTELGRMEWASPQDWMCEPWILKNTGLTVEEHQRRTVENYLTLRRLGPEIPFIPVLQGWKLADYIACANMYLAAGVDLRTEPVVGVGSVCRRQSTEEIGVIFSVFEAQGLKNLHGFGVKRAGIRAYGEKLRTADSMAWSFRARRAASDRRADGLKGSTEGCPKVHCGNCAHFALSWRDRLLGAA